MFTKLTELQNELKAPKSQFNKFGNYHYRSLEDIEQAVKPLLKKYGLALVMNDEIVQVGERYYVKATAILRDDESGKEVICTAFAREASEAKGMSDSQVTGSASSYARKYCLNALFLIDDTKDDDSNESQEEKQNRANRKKVDAPKAPQGITEDDKREIRDLVEALKEKYPTKNFTFDQFFPEGIDGFTAEQFGKAKAQLLGLLNKAAKNG